MTGRRAGLGNTPLGRDRSFDITLKLLPTRELFALKDVHNDLKISELQNDAEFCTGIPMYMQVLTYLDEGELPKHTDVRWNDIIPGSVLHMDVRRIWRDLITAAAEGNEIQVLKLGISDGSKFKSPASDYMSPTARSDWMAERAFVALYIASHRGHHRLCQKLIEMGANVNACTPEGRTVLQIAASQGHGKVIDLLLEKGADIDAEDNFGETALSTATYFDHKDSERHLFLFRWQQRAKESKPRTQHEMFAHQYYDSAFPVWLTGERAQLYFMQILPASEFEGTSFSAPRKPEKTHMLSSESLHEAAHKNHSQEDRTSYGEPVAGAGGRRRSSRGINFTTTWTDGVMSTIKEESPTPSTRLNSDTSSIYDATTTRHKGKSGSALSFDEWLAQKKAIEAARREVKRLIKEKKALEEEDSKRQKEIQDKSYDQWLASKEASTAAEGTATKRGKDDGDATTAVSGAAIGAKGTKTMDDIIRNITNRRQQQQQQQQQLQQQQESVISHEMWLTMDNADIYRRLKLAGSGPDPGLFTGAAGSAKASS